MDSATPEVQPQQQQQQQQTKPATSKSDNAGEEDVNIVDDVEEGAEPESDPELSNRSFEEMVSLFESEFYFLFSTITYEQINVFVY